MSDDVLIDDHLGSGLEVTELAKSYLREASKWARFLAIIGFVSLGLLVLMGIIFSVSMSSGITAGLPEEEEISSGMLGASMSFMYLLLALLYFFPTLYLYRFATRTRDALTTEDSLLLEGGLEQLKACFKFIGILMAIFMAFYAILLIFSVVVGASMI